MRIIVDVDAVLWDFHSVLMRKLNEEYDVPFMLPTRWDWYEEFVSKKDFYKTVDEVHAVQIDYRPFPFAPILLRNLSKYNKEVFIASHRKLGSAPALAKWLNEYDMNYYSGLYTGDNKLTLVKSGDIIIDDAPHTADLAVRKGAMALVPAWPWNTETIAARFNTLEDIDRWIAHIVMQK